MNVYFIRIINNPNYSTRFMPQEVYLDQVGLVLPILKTGGDFPNALPHEAMLYLLRRGEHMKAHNFFRLQHSHRDGQGWCNLPVPQIREDVDYEMGRASMDETVWRLIDEALQPRTLQTRRAYLPAYQDFGPSARGQDAHRQPSTPPFIYQEGIRGLTPRNAPEPDRGKMSLGSGTLVRGRDGKLRPG